MKNELDPLTTDRQFFSALIRNDLAALDEILADDFILIEVMGGSEVSKSDLLEVLRSGQLKFQTIEPADSRVRSYQTTAIVTGRTKMNGQFGETPFSTASRYTHVYVRQSDRWRMVSAQGTPISS
ncbi:MAG TPA: nuclear transport factor 2 family protein [Verrucomicrobiae bacterium]|nr:nuclear transport factor 2 family protein [Verrucomicrobiae bacterium]